jgi:hypothetical protein
MVTRKPALARTLPVSARVPAWVPAVALSCLSSVALGACAKEAPAPSVTKDNAADRAPPAPPPVVVQKNLTLGAPIPTASKVVALADVAKDPTAFKGQSITTTGTVTSVCQHMGCWMEIKDESGQAHIKMAGHGFFVPKTASGHKAKVMATIVSDDDDSNGPACMHSGGDCKLEAEKQMGHKLAKLQLEATGVELD